MTPTELREQLIEAAMRRTTVAIRFTSANGAECIVVGRPTVIQERHAIVSLGSRGSETNVLLANIRSVEPLGRAGGESRTRRDDEGRGPT